MAAKKPKRKGPKHAGVVLLKPDPERRIWHRARYKDPDTGRMVKETLPEDLTTVEQRQAWAVVKSKELAQRRLAIEGGAVRATGTSLKDAIDRYYGAHPHLGKRTGSDFRAASAKLMVWADQVGVVSADDVTRARLVGFRAWLVKQPKKHALRAGKRGQRVETEDLRNPVTINSELRRLHAILGYLRSAELLPKVTGDDLKDALKPLRVVHERKPFLRQPEIKRLLDSALKHDAKTFKETRAEHAGAGRKDIGSTPRYVAIAPFVAFVLLTGMRLNEALGLDWVAVDLDAMNQQRKKVGEIHLKGKSVKTGHARTVDLEVSPSVRSLLEALGPSTTGPVFAVTKDLASSSAKRLRAEFEAPLNFTWQALRRTCGTFLTNAPGIYGAASAFLSAKRLGHSVAIAEKHYVGVIRGIRPTARTLEAAMQIERLATTIAKRTGKHQAQGGRP